MSTAILDLVDPKGADRAQLTMGQSPLHHPFHCIEDLLPAGPEASCRFFPGQLASPLRQEQHVSLRQRVLAAGPRHLFNLHAAIAAVDAAHGIEQKDRKAPHRDKLELALCERVVAPGGPTTA